MAGSLSGVAQQQVPLSQPFQPGGNEQSRVIRQQEQEQRGNDVQVRGAPVAKAQGSDKTTEDLAFKSVSANNNSVEDGSLSQRRGSVVNLLV